MFVFNAAYTGRTNRLMHLAPTRFARNVAINAHFYDSPYSLFLAQVALAKRPFAII